MSMRPAHVASRLLGRIVAVVVFGAAAASVLALWAADAWLADLVVHFRVQYLAIGVLAAPWFAWRSRGRPRIAAVAAALVSIALNAGPIVAEFGRPAGFAFATASDSAASAVPAPTGVPLRLASANLFFLNRSHDAVIAWARAADPDVLLLLETTSEWRRALAPLEAEFPWKRYATDRSHHGLLLLSRWPLSEVLTRAPDQPTLRPVLFVTVTKQDAALRIAAMHATWPLRPREARQRGRDLAALADAAARRGPLPFVGLGDLNISPFSPHFQNLLRDSGLRSAAAGLGWQPSWPAMFPPLGIQIDHALVSPEVRVEAFRLGPSNGSDHRSLVVDVIIPDGRGSLERQ